MTTTRAALLIVDVQNDFCPGGALAVKDGDQVVPVLNRYSERFRSKGLPIYASRDWHPPESAHFAPFGGIWPVHCVQGTPGARFHLDLVLPEEDQIVSKGVDRADDGYTAFEGRFFDGSSLAERLTEGEVSHLFVGGLATDYCVLRSALDARRSGRAVTLLIDAVRAVELQPGDADRAIAEMRQAGIDTATLDTIKLP